MNLQLTHFQGPFDLLLHLIKQMEVDIHDIPMTEITQQYLAYIHAMEDIELDIVGDYLVMAATLMEIKSRLLLPVEPDPEIETDYQQDDPRDALVQQLLLYQQFQTVASQLEIRQEGRANLFNRPFSDLTSYQEAIPLEEGMINLSTLATAMENALAKYQMRQPLEREVIGESLSVSDQIIKIENAFINLNTGSKLLFSDLIEVGSPSEVVTTFLAMLELVRKQKLVFKQAHKDDLIELKLVG